MTGEGIGQALLTGRARRRGRRWRPARSGRRRRGPLRACRAPPPRRRPPDVRRAGPGPRPRARGPRRDQDPRSVRRLGAAQLRPLDVRGRAAGAAAHPAPLAPRRALAARAPHSTTARARTGKVPIPDTAGGTAENLNGRPVELIEPAQVLDDRDAGGEQDGVDRTLAGPGVVDVHGVDAHEGGTGLHQPLGRPHRDERVALVSIALRAPVLVPAGVEQDGLPGDVVPVEQVNAASCPAVASISRPGTSTTRPRSSPARSCPSA